MIAVVNILRTCIGRLTKKIDVNQPILIDIFTALLEYRSNYKHVSEREGERERMEYCLAQNFCKFCGLGLKLESFNHENSRVLSSRRGLALIIIMKHVDLKTAMWQEDKKCLIWTLSRFLFT